MLSKEGKMEKSFLNFKARIFVYMSCKTLYNSLYRLQIQTGIQLIPQDLSI